MSNGDFLERYADYAAKCTDAPIKFHQFTGLVVLAAAVGNQIWFQYGDQELYPNLWVILLAPSSAFRKSTAIGIGKKILRNVCEDLVLPNEFTQEGMCDVLEKQPQGAFFFYEFLSVMGLLKKDYMAGTKGFLTEMYDCPSIYVRRTRHLNVRIEKPCLTVLAATTIEWFLEQAREGDLYGGFLPRFLYVPVTQKTQTIPLPARADANLRNSLVKALNELRRIEGEMVLAEEAKAHYISWFNSFGARKAGLDPMFSAFPARLETYCLKFACLYQLSKDRNTTIGLKAVQRACQTTDWLLNRLRYLVDEEFAVTRFGKTRKKVLKSIKGQSGITRSDLLRAMKLPSEELDRVLKNLFQEGCIRVEDRKIEGRRRTRCYFSVERKSD